MTAFIPLFPYLNLLKYNFNFNLTLKDNFRPNWISIVNTAPHGILINLFSKKQTKPKKTFDHSKFIVNCLELCMSKRWYIYFVSVHN